MVKIENISRESIKPSSPTPIHLRTFRLSLLDQFVPPSIYVPLILYYSYDESTSNMKQDEISCLLKRSLSDALTLYYPFSGRMTDESSIDCRDQGVDFFEARVDTRLQKVIESSQVEVLSQFVPSGSGESGGLVLAIQLNYFSCGGIVIGISICHRIADVSTLSLFVKAWEASARGNTNLVAPSFVTSSLFPPKDLFGQKPRLETLKRWPITRRFCFGSSKIAALKAEVMASSSGSSAVQPTRVEVVTAAIWKWAMARKGNDNRCHLSVATHSVNLRRRMDPPLSEHAFGNIIRGAYALGNGEMDLGGLVSKMREAIGKIDREYLKELQGKNGYDMIMRNSKKVLEWYSDKEVDYFMFTSWCRFPIYEADFGWGKPVWVSCASWDTKNTIMLMDSICDVGGVEAWITMDEDDMMKFEQQAQLLGLVSGS